jgi:hypothetical protein
MQSNAEKHRPPCLLAHDLLNKLSAMIGFCDLWIEKAEQQSTNEEFMKRLVSIQALAKSAAEELKEHQCELSVLIRSTKPAKSLFR